jgi:hypothetical protein
MLLSLAERGTLCERDARESCSVVSLTMQELALRAGSTTCYCRYVDKTLP